MRSNAADYALIAPPTLTAVLQTLASDPTLTPIAGGTELMVALSAGRLPQKHLVSINHLKELRFIDVKPQAITLGAGTTFTDIRRHAVIATDFPILVQAASWTGSIANQNRGTLGGNIVNASPAADTPPALLAYDAELTLISTRGTRTIPYTDFHLSYKKTALAPDELLHSIRIERRFSAYRTYIRKVGTRNAQAISKVAIACLAWIAEGDPCHIKDIRIGAASLRETPTRCTAAEQALLNQPITRETWPATIAAARAALASEARPIDDIRSTAKYRAAVAANLLEEFLHQLAT
jgi:CO/xanthine dehydrogenase FAD-binding subunit